MDEEYSKFSEFSTHHALEYLFRVFVPYFRFLVVLGNHRIRAFLGTEIRASHLWTATAKKHARQCTKL